MSITRGQITDAMTNAPSYPSLPAAQATSVPGSPARYNEQLFEPKPAPNFLIVGAARAGTTSLWHWLRQHPQVFMARHKEPGFFLHNFRAFSHDKYLSLFKAGQGKRCIGEASTAYLSAPESPQWIYDVLGKVKIIIVLRNPVERAYSMYSLMVMHGFEPIETFEEALNQENRRMASLPFRQNCPLDLLNYQYFHAGLYIDKVSAYINIFGADQVKVLLFDDLKKNPDGFCTEVCDFLGISRAKHQALTQENSGVIPRSISLQYRLRSMRVRTRRLFGVSDRLVTSWLILAMIINKARGAKKSMPPAVRAQLVERYRPSVKQLSGLIDRDLSHWLK
jgi:hypothetical protein